MPWVQHVPGWIAAALAVGLAFYVRRHGGGAALDELERANRVLERRVQELESENVRQARELSALRARTDVASALEPVLDALRLHEERASERANKTLDVLGMIAEKLGPESEAA